MVKSRKIDILKTDETDRSLVHDITNDKIRQDEISFNYSRVLNMTFVMEKYIF